MVRLVVAIQASVVADRLGTLEIILSIPLTLD